MTHAFCKIFAATTLIAAFDLLIPRPQALAEKKPGHDRLAEAVGLLQQAEHSKNPIPLLTSAKQEVEGTLVPHRELQHDRAIRLINHAIDVALKDGKMKKAIESAIEAVRAFDGQTVKK